MSWIKKLFSRKKHSIQIGNMIFSSLGILAIVDSHECKQFSRDEFLKMISKSAYKAGMVKSRKPIHIRYWFDGPIGNQGFELYHSGMAKWVNKTVVGFSRLYLGEFGTNEVAVELAKQLLQNGNIVLLLLDFHPFLNEEEYQKEYAFYRRLFPGATIIHLTDEDLL